MWNGETRSAEDDINGFVDYLKARKRTSALIRSNSKPVTDRLVVEELAWLANVVFGSL